MIKIGTKIAAGYAILLALVVAVLVYQVSLVHRMHAINRDLAAVDVRAATISLDLSRDLDQTEEFTRKFLITGGGPGYGAQLKELRRVLDQTIRRLGALALSAKEEAETERLGRLWSVYLADASRHQDEIPHLPPPQMEARIASQLEALIALKNQTQAVIKANREAIQARARVSEEATRSAERISWLAAAVALLLSLVVSFLIVSSISRRVRHLAEGTRAVAQGKFFYQLDTTGRDELAQLAADFNTMTRRLGELDEMKKDFVSHVSHELKTPLASILETLKLMLEEIPGPLSDKQRRLIELSLQSGGRLSSMIGNLLDLSRIEAGVMRYEVGRHDLAALARRAVAEFEAPARTRNLRLEAELPNGPLEALCDGDRVLQVISNIVGNAIKFSPAGSSIRIGLSPASDIPGHMPAALRESVPAPGGRRFALLWVADRGPGIPDAEKPRIFQKFYQAGKNRAQGAGLGLTITRTIVEAHRGAIWVADNAGGGSVFYLFLPAQAVAEAAAVQTSSPI